MNYGLGAVERRRFGRRSCRVHGWVHCNRLARAACIMIDYSEGGGRLMLNEARRLPPRIYLSFDGFSDKIACEVRHEAEGAVGFEFLPKGDRLAPRSATALKQLLHSLAQNTHHSGLSR